MNLPVDELARIEESDTVLAAKLAILEFAGQINYDPDHDYKVARRRRSISNSAAVQSPHAQHEP